MQDVYKQLETVIQINGQDVNAIVRVKVESDDDFSSDDFYFENEEEKERFVRRLNRGDISPSVVIVELHALGETESVALGAVLVEKAADVDSAVEDNGLIAEATEHLLKAITDKYEMLKPYFEAA